MSKGHIEAINMLMYRAKIAGNLDEILEAVDNRYALVQFKKTLETRNLPEGTLLNKLV